MENRENVKLLKKEEEIDYFKKVIESFKTGDTDKINSSISYYQRPSKVRGYSVSDSFNEIINYLSTFYKSSRYQGTVHYSHVNYEEDGSIMEENNILNIDHKELYKIFEYCVNNQIFIEKANILFGIGATDYLSFIEKEKILDSVFKSFSEPIDGFYMSLLRVTENKNINSTEDLLKVISDFNSLDDNGKLNCILYKKDSPWYVELLDTLYYLEFKPLVDYSREKYGQIKEAKIYRPGDCEYLAGVELTDQKLAESLNDDPLLLVNFYPANKLIGRMPSQIPESNNLIGYVNIVHGDNICREIFFEKSSDVKIEHDKEDGSWEEY